MIIAANGTGNGGEEEKETRPLLLVLGSGVRPYREYVLRSVSRRYRLWLLQPAPVTWQEPYLAGSTLVDPGDVEQAVAAARAIAGRTTIAGVLCYDESLILPAAHVAAALGLSRMSPAVVAACRDKRATRAALDAARVPQARSIGVSTYDEARAAAEEIGYPVVLKPRDLSASEGVMRVDRADRLKAGYAAARFPRVHDAPAGEVDVLVEEYLDGPEISVDSVLLAGRCTPIVLARKRVGFDPFFEEIGHVVSARDPLLRDPQVCRLLEDCHDALGVREGFTHTEIRLTSRGPRIVEVNGRLGGDLIPYLGWLASGVDAPMAVADVAAGRAPDLAATHSWVAAVRFFYPRADCEVVSVDLADGALPRGVHCIRAVVEPGEKLRLPPRGYVSRYGLAISIGETEEACLGSLDAAAGLITLRGRPLDPAEVRS